MGILCGVDMIEIDRIKHSLESLGDAFRNRVFTSAEIAYCESMKVMKYQSYAARFAAKEAVSKALGTGISKGVSFLNMEVANDDAGKPSILLTGESKKLFDSLGGLDLSISLSHTDQHAIAFAVIQTREG